MPENTNLSPPVSEILVSKSPKEQPSHQPVRVGIKIPQYLLKELDAYVRVSETGSRREAVEQLLCGRLEQLRIAREQLEQQSRKHELLLPQKVVERLTFIGRTSICQSNSWKNK